ncbi:MAG: hypothetical protein GXY57_04595 [Erysipelotrichaceae bacterium]|nr:hypothetical protein [Erysipelotrichaceae bacterium]
MDEIMCPITIESSQGNSFDKVWKIIRFPLFLLLLTILTYGLFSLRPGFYLDDWYIVLFKQKFGADGFWLYFSEDRPLESLPYVIFFSIFNDSPILWALFALVMRWVFGLTFWMTLNQFFSKQRRLWYWATVIFTVYPGFKFHNFSIMFSIFYVFFGSHLLSYFGMGRAIENRSKPRIYAFWTILSMLLLFFGIAPVEYYVGVELFRPILLWIIHTRLYPKESKKIAKFVFIDWAPYLLVFIAFLFYRISQRDVYSYRISLLEKLQTTPIITLFQLIKDSTLSLANGLLRAWFETFRTLINGLMVHKNYAMLGMAAIGFIFVFGGLIYLFRKEKWQLDFEPLGWLLMPIGLFLSAISLIPFYAGGFEVSLDFPWNRFYLAMLPGISIFTVGAIEFLFRTNKIKNFVFGALCFLAIGSHYVVGTEFVEQWNKQADLMRQLTWRVPGLQTGTTLMTADSPTEKYFSGTALTGPIGIIYDANNLEKKYNYFVVLMDSNQAERIPSLDSSQDFSITLRSLEFIGNTESILVYLQPEVGCVQVLSDGIVPNVPNLEHEYSKWKELAFASNLETIVTRPVQPASLPSRYFGEEDTNQWCFYYEKADLARQLGDWQGVIDYYQDAKNQGFKPLNGSEYRILVEAWLQQSKSSNALTLKEQLTLEFPEISGHWCTIAKELLASEVLSKNDRSILTTLSTQEACGN